MHLIRLLDEQVANNWDVIKLAIRQSLPPVAGESPEKMNNILQAILLGGVQVWATSPDVEVSQLRTLTVSYIMTDPLSGVKSFLLYSFYGFVRVTEEDMQVVFEGLSKYAKAKQCKRLAAYIQNPIMLQMVRRFGVDESWTFTTKEL